MVVIQYPSDSDSYTLNRNVVCVVTICKSTTFKIILTVYHQVSAGIGKQGSFLGRGAFRKSRLSTLPVRSRDGDHPLIEPGTVHKADGNTRRTRTGSGETSSLNSWSVLPRRTETTPSCSVSMCMRMPSATRTQPTAP